MPFVQLTLLALTAQMLKAVVYPIHGHRATLRLPLSDRPIVHTKPAWRCETHDGARGHLICRHIGTHFRGQ